MQHRGSLKGRIVKAYVLLAVLLCACFSTIVFFSVRAIEDKLIDARLIKAAKELIDNHVAGQRRRVPGEPVVWDGPETPLALRPLRDGEPQEVQLDGRALHVLMIERDRRRYAIVDDESDYERIETDIWTTLAGASAMCVVLAFVLGRATASRVMAPVIALSKEVQDPYAVAPSTLRLPTDEVGVLARAFAERSAAMQSFLVREQLFTGDVSHELRTPLTIMLGAAELLAVRLQDRVDLLPIVERIRRTAADLADRVGALLLLSRSPESVDAPPTDLVPLVEQEIERCRPLLQGRAVVLRLDVKHEATVFARAELASIAIGNLIRNACQFTEQGEITVTVEAGQLTVEDTGVGIPEEISARVFDRFMRAAPRDIPGTGLGLAIVKRVTDHLGWQVAHASRPEGGTRFVVTFSSAPRALAASTSGIAS
jgi:signal transduction histidine kinase